MIFYERETRLEDLAFVMDPEGQFKRIAHRIVTAIKKGPVWAQVVGLTGEFIVHDAYYDGRGIKVEILEGFKTALIVYDEAHRAACPPPQIECHGA